MANYRIPGAHEKRQIREWFQYDASTGHLSWAKVRRGVKRCQHNNAGSVRKDGYKAIRLNGQDYLVHRLAVFLHTGAWPDGYVDHINGDTTDNRAANLRVVTTAQNVFNARRRCTNSTGLKGVSRHLSGKFVAEIGANYERHYLGIFDTPEEAHQAYCEAAKNLHGPFARVD